MKRHADSGNRNIRFVIVSAFVLLSAVSFFLFQRQKDSIRQTQERELKVIADYKVNEILNWRNRYFQAAEEINYEDKVRQFAVASGKNSKSALENQGEFEYYLKELSGEYDFSGIYICDAEGNLLIPGYSTNEEPDHLIADICGSNKQIVYPQLSEFHKDNSGKIHLTLIVPVFNFSGTEKKLVAYFFGRIHPDKILYPMIKTWPFESLTSEAVLVQDRGDSIVFLNELRHVSGAALTHRLSKKDTSRVGIKAYTGNDRFAEGIDYRGAEVLSYLKRIPETDWALVVKTDKQELMRPVFSSFAYISGAAVTFLSVVVLGFVLMYRRDSRKMVQSLYEKEIEKNMLLKQHDYILQNAGDCVFLVDSSGKIVDANHKALSDYGYSREEIIGQPIERLRGNSGLPDVRGIMKELHDKDGLIFETTHRKKNGRVFPVEVSAKLLELNGRFIYQSIVRDITERKRSEARINKLNRNYSMLSASNKAIVRKTDADSLFEEVTRIAIQLGKFNGVWFGKTKENGTPVTIRQEGFENGNQLFITVLFEKNLEQLLSRFSGKTVYYCNSVRSSEVISDEEKSQISAASFAVMKLQNPDGTTVFALFVSDEENYFGEEDIQLLDEMAEDLSFGLKFFTIEKSFKTTEAHFRTIVEEFPAGVFTLDTDGRLTYNNKVINEITGYDNLRLSSYGWMRILQQGDRDDLIRKWTDAINYHRSFNAQGSILRSNGSKVFWRAKTSPIYSEGEIIGYAGMLFDETEIIQQQAEINRLFAAVSQTSSSILVTDLNGTIEYVNPAFEKMTGYTSEEAIGRNPRFLQSGQTPGETYIQLFEQITNGNPWRGEFINKRKNGEIYYESAVITPVKDSAGKTVNYLAIKDDITLMRNYQKTIQEQVKLLENVLELLPVGVWIMDERGVILRGNSMAQKIWEGAKYVGMEGIREYKARWYKTGEEILQREWASFRALSNREISINEEIEIEFNDGRKKIIYNSAVPMINTSGELTGAIIVNEDITAIKQAENELIAAKERAEESNRLKGSFLANMSHELRTPMIGVLGYSEIMYDGDFGDEVTEYSRLIHKSGKRLLDTLNLILDLSRIEAGKIDLKNDNVDLVKTTVDVIQNFRGAAERNGLYIRFDTEFLFLNVRSDERLLINILDNLVNNAVKYTPTGGVTVSISSVEKNEAGKRMVKISIADTGIGIAKENHELIFEEFRQVSEGTDRGYEGSGLGLSITKKFLEKLNGAITLESEAGCGSVFHIFLPADVIEEKRKEKTPEYAEPEIKKISSSKKKILLVENDELNVTIIKKYLYEKYIVEQVWNAAMAIKLGNENRYDAVLMDINLGEGLDGLAAAREIRNGEMNRNTPVIAMTAYAMQQDRETFLEKGCTHYLAKPFRQIELLRVLEDVMAGKPGEIP